MNIASSGEMLSKMGFLEYVMQGYACQRGGFSVSDDRQKRRVGKKTQDTSTMLLTASKSQTGLFSLGPSKGQFNVAQDGDGGIFLLLPLIWDTALIKLYLAVPKTQS